MLERMIEGITTWRLLQQQHLKEQQQKEKLERQQQQRSLETDGSAESKTKAVESIIKERINTIKGNKELEKNYEKITKEAESLLELEKEMFMERKEMFDEVTKQPGHRMKIVKLKEMLDSSKAH